MCLTTSGTTHALGTGMSQSQSHLYSHPQSHFACCAGACNIHLDNGRSLRAGSAAYCTTYSMPIAPPLLVSHNNSSRDPANIFHESQFDVPATCLEGKAVAVVGGRGRGHAAAQLSLGAIRQGAACVVLLMQDDLGESSLPLEVRELHAVSSAHPNGCAAGPLACLIRFHRSAGL